MTLLDELFKKTSNLVPNISGSSQKEVIIEKQTPVVGSGGGHTGAISAKCKGCGEIIMLTPKFSEFTCRCGTNYSLPKG